MHSPAILVIVDPLGRSCGISSSGATIVRHVPGCAASAPGSEPQLMELPNAVPGTYRAVITSIEPGGAFTLTATGINERGTPSFDLSLGGAGRPGAMFGSALEVRAGPDGRLNASSLSALVALQAPPGSSSSLAPTANTSVPTTFPPNVALPTTPGPSATVAAASHTASRADVRCDTDGHARGERLVDADPRAEPNTTRIQAGAANTAARADARRHLELHAYAGCERERRSQSDPIPHRVKSTKAATMPRCHR